MPLTLRPSGLGSGSNKDRSDYTVYSGQWNVGRNYEVPGGPDNLRWFWCPGFHKVAAQFGVATVTVQRIERGNGHYSGGPGRGMNSRRLIRSPRRRARAESVAR
jgi:hypothetical protein